MIHHPDIEKKNHDQNLFEMNVQYNHYPSSATPLPLFSYPTTPIQLPHYPYSATPLPLFSYPTTPLQLPHYPYSATPLPLFSYPTTPIQLPHYPSSATPLPLFSNTIQSYIIYCYCYLVESFHPILHELE